MDTGSSVNVLYWEAFKNLGLKREQLSPIRTPLSGFTGDSVDTEGLITLPVEVGEFPVTRKMNMDFVVVKLPTTHNMILGRPGLDDLGAIISMPHLCMKFPTPKGVGRAKCDRAMARKCYLRACKGIWDGEGQVHTVVDGEETASRKRPRCAEKATLRDSDKRPESAEQMEEIPLDESRPERVVKIGTGLTKEVRADVVAVIRKYQVIFAWGPEDMPGVDRSIITHRLSISPTHRPVKQKKRYLATDRREFVKKEVDMLLSIRHIREVDYPEWLANVVLAPKGATWRMCVDYTDLNKACPKDPFPLPRIDILVDETAGCALLNFMDAFRGYHQIFMEEGDEEKTAFVTPDGVFCYIVMAFGLKNSGATYTRMVAKLFGHLLGKNMEAYVDDMLVKSRVDSTHAEDLACCFEIMEKFNLRLNPKKCAFAVRGGKFLGYMVTQRGIEPNPEKVKDILNLQPPRNVKEVQGLTGRMAALSRFLSKSADRALPFFQAMKKGRNFEWTEECQKNFDELKQYLSSPPLLSKPKEGEVLYLYLAASQYAVSSVLIREEGDRKSVV